MVNEVARGSHRFSASGSLFLMELFTRACNRSRFHALFHRGITVYWVYFPDLVRNANSGAEFPV
jgi:hypothetical protein